MKINAVHHQRIGILFAALLIFFLGRLSVLYERAGEITPLQTINEINPGIPMVRITNIQDAQIMGSVSQANIRITSGAQVAVPEEDLNFRLDIQHLGYIGPKRKIIEHVVPEWAQFVASKKGKYYYEMNEKQAKRLSVPNRMYFGSEEEAKNAGYLRRGL